MSLNDKIASRHGSRPFSVMFGRAMNGFDDYREVESLEGAVARKKWEKEIEQLANDIWPLIHQRGEETGYKSNKRGNKKGKYMGRKDPLLEGQLVLKLAPRMRGKMLNRWEGPFKVTSYDEKLGGYHLVELTGKKREVKGAVPLEKLKVVDEAFSEEEEDGIEYEVEEILRHGEGDDGEMLYKVKWRGYDETSWETADKFSKNVIIKYWQREGKSLKYGKEMAKGKKKSSSSSSSSSSKGSTSSSSSSSGSKSKGGKKKT